MEMALLPAASDLWTLCRPGDTFAGRPAERDPTGPFFRPAGDDRPATVDEAADRWDGLG